MWYLGGGLSQALDFFSLQRNVMRINRLILIAVLAIEVSSGEVLACRCGKPPIEKSFQTATAIFSGEVVKVDFFRATLKVKKMWKGKPAKEIIMLTGTTLSPEGYYISSSCDYGYILGEKHLIYAYGSEGELKSHFCSRSRLLEYAGDEIKELDKLKERAEEQKDGK